MAFTPPRILSRPTGMLRVGDPATDAYVRSIQGNNAAIRAEGERKMASQRRWERGAKLASAAIVGGSVAPALFGGGAAATTAAAPTVAGSTVPAAASGGLTLGKILSNPLTTLGVNTVSSIFGARSANNANRYAVDRQAEGLAKQLAMEEKRLADEAAELRAQRVEDQRRWEAQEAHNAKILAASEDERLYNRGIEERRQARIAAYDPLRQRALRSVGSILGF